MSHKVIQILIKCTAQSIMRWMLQVPVLPQENFSELGFSAALDYRLSNEPKLRVCNILKRVPAMINLYWGNSPASQLVFVNIYPNTDLPKDLEESDIRDEMQED